MNLMKSLRSVVVLLALLSAGMANAGLYLQFDLTGAYNASWRLDPTVTPDNATDGIAFALYDVDGNFPGSLTDLVDLYFYNADLGGGLEIDDFYGQQTLLLTDGAQLYTGSESAPTFRLGAFVLTDSRGSGTYLLTVTDVPEPATAALLICGLGLMFSRRKHQIGK